MNQHMGIVAVIPAFRAAQTIGSVIEAALVFVDAVVVVVDGCEETKAAITYMPEDPRVHKVIRVENGGVGAAMKDGFRQALRLGADIVVKIDADSQMDPRKIPTLVKPIQNYKADMTKGNRFASPAHVKGMPLVRLLGNAFLSLITKVSSGYWSINDPTNGYLAIRMSSLLLVDYEKLHEGYFFESDLLHRAGIAQLRVRDVSMSALYPSQVPSNLSVFRTLVTFPALHFRNFIRRIAYKYYLKEWSLATFELPLGTLLMVVGAALGIQAYLIPNSASPLTAQQSVFVAISLISGLQLLLSWLHYDIESEPSDVAIHPD